MQEYHAAAFVGWVCIHLTVLSSYFRHLKGRHSTLGKKPIHKSPWILTTKKAEREETTQSPEPETISQRHGRSGIDDISIKLRLVRFLLHALQLKLDCADTDDYRHDIIVMMISFGRKDEYYAELSELPSRLWMSGISTFAYKVSKVLIVVHNHKIKTAFKLTRAIRMSWFETAQYRQASFLMFVASIVNNGNLSIRAKGFCDLFSQFIVVLFINRDARCLRFKQN